MKETGTGRQLLVIGGDADPNLKCLAAAAERAGEKVLTLFAGHDTHPAITWDVNSGTCLFEGRPLRCSAAFIRHDVFTGLADKRQASHYRALAWFTTVHGWLAVNPNIKIFNRKSLNQVTNKPQVLHLAQAAGLAVPHTIVTNDFSYIEENEAGTELVVKPVNGGGYCESFKEVTEKTDLKNGRAAAPAIVQNRLAQPEVRIYIIGEKLYAFNMVTDELDYRTTQNCRVVYREEVPEELIPGYRKLLGQLDLDFAAADFKTDPEDGELKFLEVNTGPMFAAFDAASNGILCDAMVEALLGKRK
jgi:glutathione synthase/RimK-type ligase-like ATP-grasp enzyme